MVDDQTMNTTTPPVSDTTIFGCSNNAVVPPNSASQINGIASYSFCRPLNSGETCDSEITLNQQMNVLCAHGKSNTVCHNFLFLFDSF
jgi:hypothetical protein